jgi:hypothetical protein
MNRQAVEHFTEGKEAWRLGVLGFFTRTRGQIGAAIIAFLAMGVPWWWPRNYTETITISTKTLIVAILFVVGVLVVAGLCYLKKRSLRSLDIKYYLHGLAHYIRDQYTDCCRQSASPYAAPDADRSQQFCERLGQMCERTKTYFRCLTNDETIEVAMRLAVPQRVAATNISVVYRTVARSAGLNQSRYKTTEDILANEGIPRFLKHKKNSLGVLFYNDLGAAAELGTYRLTENDKLYAAEIKTMMVAPLNGWDGKKQNMIGLFYVTSRETNTFKPKYVDSMAFISDFVANAVASLVNKLYESHRLPSLNPRS